MIPDSKNSKRCKHLSRSDVKEYLKQYPDVTPEEKLELAKWLESGEDFRDNDCRLYDERGVPLDFIDARRIMMDLYAMQVYDTPVSEPYVPWEDDYDLPF